MGPGVSAVMMNGVPRSRNLFALPLDEEPNGDQRAYFYPRRSHTSQPKRCPGGGGIRGRKREEGGGVCGVGVCACVGGGVPIQLKYLGE